VFTPHFFPVCLLFSASKVGRRGLLNSLELFSFFFFFFFCVWCFAVCFSVTSTFGGLPSVSVVAHDVCPGVPCFAGLPCIALPIYGSFPRYSHAVAAD
jgi:hypothetical protein